MANGNMTRIPSVVDNLTSTSTTSALSANQGKVLNDNLGKTTRVFLDTGISYQKCGGICVVELEGLSITKTGTTTLGTLPAGYRPIGNAQATLLVADSPASGWITASGIINVYAYKTGNLSGSFSFVVNN